MFIQDSGSLCRIVLKLYWLEEKKGYFTFLNHNLLDQEGPQRSQSDLLQEGFWSLFRFQIWLICQGTWNQQTADLDLLSLAICLQCVTPENSLYFSEPYFPSSLNGEEDCLLLNAVMKSQWKM